MIFLVIHFKHSSVSMLIWNSLTIPSLNSAQCYVAVWIGREFGGKWIRVYVWLSSFAVYLKLPQYCLSAISQYKIKSLKKNFLIIKFIVTSKSMHPFSPRFFSYITWPNTFATPEKGYIAAHHGDSFYNYLQFRHTFNRQIWRVNFT